MLEPVTGVDLIPVESQTRTIQTCFQQCLYEVPNFQRPYSWTEEQLIDFWDDVVLAYGDFFFGSTVTWVSEKRGLFNDTYSIIDGQQRLTTSAIILSVIRDVFYSIQKRGDDDSGFNSGVAKSQAEATHRYLIIADDDGIPHRVLTRPEKMFYEHIQNPSAIPSGVAWNGSAKRIGEARTFFESRVLNELEDSSLERQVERLKEIRANVLKARVIQVELASEEDGFLVFETLNTRGSDLRLSDLVKNLLIRGGAASSLDRQTVSERWDRMVEKVQEGRVSQDVVDRFIWQSWNSRRSAVKEPELFKEISRMVDATAEQHLLYLSELEVDSKTYEWLEFEGVQVQAVTPNVRNAFAVPEFVDSVRALAIFNVSVTNSTVLAIVRKYQETTFLKRAKLIEVMRLVESFHFQFSALTSTGSTGGTRSRYNRFAVRLEAAKSAKEVVESIEDLKEKLRNSLPRRDRVQTEFRELFYAPSIQLNQVQKPRARKIFISYVLMSFAKYHNLLPAGQNLASWSIEHIKPQESAGGGFRDPVYSIGNLALLTAALNSDLGNASWAKKVEPLRKGCAYFDSELETWARDETGVPTNEQINARALHLAIEAFDHVWNF